MDITASTWASGKDTQPQWGKTDSGMARSAPLKADPQLPKDRPALMAVYPPADKSCMHQPIPGGQGGPAEIPSGHTCSG